MNRRTFGLGALAALAVPAEAHTPYRQWVVYRRKHLMIGAHRENAVGYGLAKAAAAELAAHLPAASARVARAPSPPRLAALMATDQLDLAVLEAGAAADLMGGAGAFASIGPQSVATLAMVGVGHALIAHDRFPGEHGALVADTLIGTPVAPRLRQSGEPPCPWRPEVVALLGR